MRKFFLGAALVAASFGMAQSADAATVMDVDGVSTLHAVHIKDRLCHRKKPAFNHVKTMTLHTLCGIHAGKGNEQETIIDYKTSKLYKQNEKVILFIQPSYGNSNRIKFV